MDAVQRRHFPFLLPASSAAALAAWFLLAMAPWAGLRALGWIVVASWVMAVVSLHGRETQAFRAAPLVAFLVSFGTAPVWTLLGDPRRQYAFLTFLVAAGLAVGWIGVRGTRWRGPGARPRDPALFSALLCCTFLLYWRSLTASITWRGDSDIHMHITQSLSMYLAGNPVVAVAIAVGCVFAIAYASFGKWQFLAAAAGSVVVGVIADPLRPAVDTWSCRYPLAYHALSGFVALSSLMAEKPLAAWVRPAEIDYRLLSATAIAGAAWLVARTRERKDWTRALLGLAVLTMPVHAYYAGLTYIEPLSVLCMTAVLLSFPRCADAFLKTGRMSWPLTSLILLGFLKETNIVFTLCVLAAVSIRALRLHGRQTGAVAALVRLWTICMVPYLVFGAYRGNVRGYHFAWQNALEFANWEILARSFVEQFGVLGIVSLACGLWALARWRSRWRLTVALGTVCGYAIFYMCEGPVLDRPGMAQGTHYFGYSRFNYYYVPGLLAMLAQAGSLAKNWNRGIVAGLLAAITVCNVAVSPVDPISGSRKAGWGDYTVATSEYDFKYDELFAFLRERGAAGHVLVLGRTYPYPDAFYLKKYGLKDRGLKVTAQKSLELPVDYRRYDRIVVHSLRPGAVRELPAEGIGIEKVFTGWGTELVVFSFADRQPGASGDEPSGVVSDQHVPLLPR